MQINENEKYVQQELSKKTVDQEKYLIFNGNVSKSAALISNNLTKFQ